MIQIDKTDFLYKTLQKLGEQDLDKQYLEFASEGVSSVKEFNNLIQSRLGLDYLGDFDESWFEEVADYYKDLHSHKLPAKNKVASLLKEYNQNPKEDIKKDIINSQLNEVLLIACAYKVSHPTVNLNDAVQICNIGLINAVNKFDVDAKLSFELYLNYWIMKEIQKEFTQGEKNG